MYAQRVEPGPVRGRSYRPLTLRFGSKAAWIRLLSIICFILLWESVAFTFEYYGMRQARVLPLPHDVAWKLLGHLFGDLTWTWDIRVWVGRAIGAEMAPAIAVTLWRVAQAFTIAMILGTVAGIFLGRFKSLDTFFDGWLVLGLNMPALVVGILCYVWFGLDEQALVIAVVINKMPMVAVTVREGARAVDRELLQVAGAFRVSPHNALFKVYLPQLYPYIMAAARGGLALIWKIILVYELLGLSSGVGYRLSLYFGLFDIKSILAYAFAFIGVVLCIEMFLMRPVERRMTAWRL